ncbi:aminopeptidase P family protein [Spirulina sp. CS-785/01]|uniref:aminopeptidase P family protein n=1 Tax=Spirulina sp. CS-785/01 TaxID=3021716 RepID=UPI00232D1601|nr:aminopeptidase P family protein [Spirulina sp. CS-785/01]MDB9315856.1 aminopeptidase P family protein [Spirulina sp. CS-785/01]
MTIQQRRQKLGEMYHRTVLLWSGQAPSRNFPANLYPFRASSHFLYFTEMNLENAVIRLDQGNLTLYYDDPPPSAALWQGEKPSRDRIAAQLDATAAYPLSELPHHHLTEAATLPVQDKATYQQQCHLLQRPLPPPSQSQGPDLALAKAIITLRLAHDEAALAQIRQAAQVSINAHKTGIQTAKTAQTEAQVRGAMEGVILAHNFTCAYPSIVTKQGEVLHNEVHYHSLQNGDLILADVGAETELGWASDLTRTFPVKGRFSSTQREIYDLVLRAHDTCIEQMGPGVEYQDIHCCAARVLAAGLVELGILRGQPEELVAQDVHALFFPHGVGHLLGLDVHDMEDLGDLAGYAPGRQRSDRFGLKYLRLNRPLQPGMVVTIEPGFYQVPRILNDPNTRKQYQKWVNWEKLAQFADVRGIRIEDDVLVTQTGSEVLTAALPTQGTEIEALMNTGA